ncbi:MAG TPA: hypothetical protein DER33_06795 [Syntrophomonas sp.]|jgi:hypothetical protein|nr:hypothetical protein [Syntrophomonas sp.]
MQVNKGMVMNRESFLQNGLWSKEEYEGLIVSGDTARGGYNIAVEIGDDMVLVVDQVKDNEVKEKVQAWSSEIVNIQRQYGFEP